MDMRMATEADQHLSAYDHSTLSAINMCPTWGILTRSMQKKMPNTKRSMALEAGSTSHEGFAAIRLYQYMFHDAKTCAEKLICIEHGQRLFGRDRFSRMGSVLDETATERTNTINFAIEAIESSGFYDDITDRKRTLSNITESIISYIDAYDMTRYPLWIRDSDDAETDIGIEIPFDIVVTIKYQTTRHECNYNVINSHSKPLEEIELVARFIGKLDGLHYNKGELIVIEDKSGSRLDDAWLSQWVLSHQITGYCLAASTFTGLSCNHALVSGMRIPIGRVPAEGIRKEYVPRTPIMFEKWANWFVTTIQLEQQYINNVVEAPMYTHSCNRYFSRCSLLPFCAADTVEEKLAIIEEMDDDDWSPLND